MGKVRTETVKKTARQLIAMYPSRFTADFEENKRVVSEVVSSDTKRLRNRIAGYVTRLRLVEEMRKASPSPMAETEIEE